jgi:hypothetical protein
MPNWCAIYEYEDEPGYGNSGASGFTTIEADTAEEAEVVARGHLNPKGLSLKIEPDDRNPPIEPAYKKLSK